MTISRPLSVIVLLAVLAGSSVAWAADRPNVLWITCEDISPNLGCYGDDFARTPTLDALAERGVRYTNAYGITGVCAVNRSCIITGMYSSSIGSQGMRSKTRLPDFMKCFSELLRDEGYYCTNNSKTDYNFPVPPNAWDECDNKAHWRKRAEGQPFFAIFNFTVTHESQYRLPDEAFFKRTARLTEDERHDPAETPIPPFHPDTPEARQDWARYYDTITAMDYQAADVLAQLEEDGLADDTIVFFYSDHGAGMPGCKKWVWTGGLQVPLIVHFPEKYKNWAPAADGDTTDRLVSFVDLAPTVLSLTGAPIPPHMQGHAFLGPKSGEPREFVYAIRDRMAERYDLVRAVRSKEFQYNRDFMPHLPWSQFTSYTEEMPTMKVWRRLHDEGKLNAVQDRYFQKKPPEELYDTKNDPHQIHNLADDPKYAAALKSMRGELHDWMIETGDLGLLGEYEMLKRAEGSTPYEVGQDPELNPAKSLLITAAIANSGNLDRLDMLSAHDDDAIARWAMIGMAALGEDAKPAIDVISNALDDDSPLVRIAAAEAVYNCGGTDKALAALEEALKDDSPHVRLHALNVLDRMGADAAPLIPAIKAAAMPTGAPLPADYVNRMSEYVPQHIEAALEAAE